MNKETGGITAEYFQEELQCPVCLKIPRTTPIYQCNKGHIHCSECRPQLKSCPVCRASLRSMCRNLRLEQIIEKFPQKCINHENGCQQPPNVHKEMSKHETNCKFRKVPCIDSTCKNSVNGQFIVNDFEKHMKQIHCKVKMQEIDEFRGIAFISSTFRPSFSDTEWDLSHVKFDGRDFLFKRSMIGDCFRIYVFMIGSVDEVKHYKCKIEARSDSSHMTSVEGTGKINTYEFNDEDDLVPIIILTRNQLKEMTVKCFKNFDRFLEFKVTVMANLTSQM